MQGVNARPTYGVGRFAKKRADRLDELWASGDSSFVPSRLLDRRKPQLGGILHDYGILYVPYRKCAADPFFSFTRSTHPERELTPNIGRRDAATPRSDTVG